MKKINQDKEISDLISDFGDWFNKGYEIPTMSNSLYPYKNMFTPIKINNITIKNRLIMGPMGNINMCEETGRPNQKMLAYFEARAKGGVGLITTGLIPTTFGIDNALIEKGGLTYFPRIDRSRTVLSAWRDLAAIVHSHGSNIFIQLTAGVGRVGNPQCLVTQLKFPVSSSFNPNFYIPQIPCKRLSGIELRRIIKKTEQAAVDAKTANIDGVYLHGHEGYLLEQLTNPAFNRRKIGRYANYQNFGLDMVRAIRSRCGDKFPIMYRIDLSLALGETYGKDMLKDSSLKKFTNGRTIKQTLEYMENLVKAGVDIFDIDIGCYENWWLPHPPSSMPAGCFLTLTELVKKHFKSKDIRTNQGQEVPIVAVGKLGYPDMAEKVLREGKADMIMLARPLLSDPEWPNKVFAGKTQEIIPCIGCQEACIQEFLEGGHPQCSVCPRTGFEDEFSEDIPRAETPKRIAIIGSGPAGITAAQILIKRGHIVDLYEREENVGGILNSVNHIKIKYEIYNYLTFLRNIIENLKQNSNFNLFTKTNVDVNLLKLKNYEIIIMATGSKQIKPKIDGAENRIAYNILEVLNKPDIIKKAKKIVVVGGGDSGCEIAYYLRYELGKEVEIIESSPELMTHTCTANRCHLIYYLKKAGVQVHNCSNVLKILNDGIIMEKNISKSVPDPFNTWNPVLPKNIKNPFAKKIKSLNKNIEIKADVIILAVGSFSDNKLFYECQNGNVAPLILNIGDSFKVGSIFNATKSAYRTARKL